MCSEENGKTIGESIAEIENALNLLNLLTTTVSYRRNIG